MKKYFVIISIILVFSLLVLYYRWSADAPPTPNTQATPEVDINPSEEIRPPDNSERSFTPTTINVKNILSSQERMLLEKLRHRREEQENSEQKLVETVKKSNHISRLTEVIKCPNGKAQGIISRGVINIAPDNSKIEFVTKQEKIAVIPKKCSDTVKSCGNFVHGAERWAPFLLLPQSTPCPNSNASEKISRKFRIRSVCLDGVFYLTSDIKFDILSHEKCPK